MTSCQRSGALPTALSSASTSASSGASSWPSPRKIISTLMASTLLAAARSLGADARPLSAQPWLPSNALALPGQGRHLLQAQATGLCPLPGDVLQHHMDLNNTGVNFHATGLAAAQSRSFGIIGRRNIDGGQIMAQPLHLEQITLANGSLGGADLVATMNNTVALLDSNPSVKAPLWTTKLGAAVPAASIDASDIKGNIGVLSTPVVDRCNNTVYAVSFQTPSAGATPQFRVFALDLDTGEPKHAPITLQGTFPGTGESSVNGVITFNATQHLQRPALKLNDQGLLAIGFGSHGDIQPYFGWQFYVNTEDFTVQAIHALCADSNGCALWQAGEGPGVYKNDWVWVAGNGFDSDPTKRGELTESIFRIAVNGAQANITDSYTPSNFQSLDDLDQDVGSNGPLITGHRVLSGGKAGILYDVNLDHMGGIAANGTATSEQIQASSGLIYGAPVAWKDLRFVWPGKAPLQCYRDKGDAGLELVWKGSVQSPTTAYPGGGFMAIAAGDNDGKAVLVAVVPGATGEDATTYLFDAESGDYIWSSQENPDRDSPGVPCKFVPPLPGANRFLTVNQQGDLLTYGFITSGSGGRGA